MNPDTLPFTITDRRGLEWYIRKIAAIDAEIARVQEQAKAIIADLERDRQSLEFQFGSQVQSVTQKLLEGKRAKHLKTIFGNIGYRTKPARLEIADPAALLEWSRQNAPDLLETRVTLSRLSEYFKPSADGSTLYALEHGEPINVPGIKLQPAKEVLYIRAKEEVRP
jgi:hypothetical protein